jgi:uncharacterized protein YegL
MSGSDQLPYTDRFDDSIFVTNPESRCPCVLVLDTSGSMSGRPIQELNDGLRTLREELLVDELAAKRVELGVITFGPVTTDVEFGDAHNFNPPILSAGGDTPMGTAISAALAMLDRRKSAYKQNGISYYRPWIFLITDGSPTDDCSAATRMIKEGESKNQFAFFAIGVSGADMSKLSQISVRPPLKLDGLRFRDLFSWLSKSLQAVSQSQVGQTVPLPPPGWTSV